MIITDEKFYGSSKLKIGRLGLYEYYNELKELLINSSVELLEEKKANGSAEIRKLIDTKFNNTFGWKKKQLAGIDWIKENNLNRIVTTKIGVKIQVSARSDLLIKDIVQLRRSFLEDQLDVGVIIVPDNTLSLFLPDRTPSLRDAVRYIETEFIEAKSLPLIIIAIRHDRAGSVLPKTR